jgi:DNA-binding MarR family transcriptional regulator
MVLEVVGHLQRHCQEANVPATPDKDGLVDDILALADKLFRELLPTVPKDLLTLDITMPQTKILLILHVQGARRMSDLANELDITLPAVTSLVDRLVDKGYVVRETWPDDRRVVLCHLSQAGEHAIGRIWQSARRRSQQLLQGMPVSKLELLVDALQAMHDISRVEPGAEPIQH